MLQLKYLFENFEMAKKIISFYDHDDLSYLKHFRISANAIYPFQYENEVYYLRVTPKEETKEEWVQNEVNLLLKFEELNFPSLRIVKDKNGNDFGFYDEHFYLVTRQVKGQLLEDVEMTNELARDMGSTLNSLHDIKLSFKYRTDLDVLKWCEDELERMNESSMNDEIESLKMELLNEPNVLCHYDYDLDNIFINDKIEVIDFNDSMMSIKEIDICNTLKILDKRFHDAFIKGYGQEIDQDKMDVAKRFSKVYKNTRLKRSIYEEVENPPDWMINLKEKLKLAIE